MSMFHMGVIRNFLTEKFTNLIDLSDYDGKSEEDRENAFLTRSLAAFSLMMLCEISPVEAGKCVTDGYNDNGIDALYYHKKEKVLYLIQSKWKNDGNGSVERGDIQKFFQGIRDLTIPKFEKFNEKVLQRKDEIEMALRNANTKFMVLLTYTGQADLSSHVNDDINSFLDELNDSSEFVTFKALKQSNIYNMIAKGAQGEPINVDVALSNWGYTSEPFKAYYGQVAASDIALWWEEYYPRLFAQNIRMFLGDTDVNNNIIKTLKEEPEKFWYYNNGITALCSTIKKKPIGGNTRDYGLFEIEDLKIVNGAQTAGAIALAARNFPEKVALARVPIRFIQLKDSPENFEREVTRNTNTQNRIEKRDFVALDPEQERIKEELNLHGITYIYKSGDTITNNQDSFDIVEATIARACNQIEVDLSVQAKREIGKLWEDIERAPYKILFNSSVNSLELWKQVQILRVVDEMLSQKEKELNGRERLYTIHGNRFIAQLVFMKTGEIQKAHTKKLTQEEKELIKRYTVEILLNLISLAESEYPDSMLASLFKNLTKCKNLHTKYLSIANL
ncbi:MULTISPECIES: AIPR family protein [Aeribacillus]|uniref:AIPR family protein n=1 Tax=Aeribacillus TaxID=1055323 RepID=UPI0007B46852|nr:MULTISPECIES: AIPR family protein [Aeribacillus]KZM57062.1 abortive phage infection protein [Aeribacillus pallidus]MED0652080.1 AIPR family protein [Aeribacillus composti]MED4488431.1 AIPR family protein [Aeribacillus pallidus]